MKTTFVNPKALERKWYILDATDKVLGRFSTEVANTLRGKNKPCFSPSHDCGDFVIIINADKVKLSGDKLATKKYYGHSQYPGGFKEETAASLQERAPERVIQHAIAGMLPRTRIHKDIMSKLKIYAGSEHPHEAQKPVNLDI